MTLTYTLRFRDLWLFNAVHQARSIALQFVYILFASLSAYSTASSGACSSANCTLTALLAFALVYIAMFGIQLAFNAAFLFSRNNKNVLTQHRVEIRTEGLYDETSYSRCLFLWPGILKVVRAAGLTAIYVTAHSAILVPNRIFPTPSDRDDFMRKIEEGASAA